MTEARVVTLQDEIDQHNAEPGHMVWGKGSGFYYCRSCEWKAETQKPPRPLRGWLLREMGRISEDLRRHGADTHGAADITFVDRLRDGHYDHILTLRDLE